MKSFIKPLTAVMALFASVVIFASCESDSTEVFGPGEYVGQYDESMTPENSCVIYFTLDSNSEATFRQINPDLDVDEQHFEFGPFDRGWVVFKPCKPGSRYMLTKLRGGDYNYRWDMDFKPNQQVMVIDVPKEPGVYCYGFIMAQDVALCASEGKAYSLCKPDDLDAKPSGITIGCTMKDAIKNVNSEFKKLYGQTPWYDAYLEKREVLLSTPKANK